MPPPPPFGGGAPSTRMGLPPQASLNAVGTPPSYYTPPNPGDYFGRDMAMNPNMLPPPPGWGSANPTLSGSPSYLIGGGMPSAPGLQIGAPMPGMTQQQTAMFSPAPQGYAPPPELIGAPMPTGMMQPQVMPPAPGTQLGQPPSMGAMPFGAVGQPPNFSNFTLPTTNPNAQMNSNAMNALQQAPANFPARGRATLPQQQGAMPQPALAPTAMARGGLNRLKGAMGGR